MVAAKDGLGAAMARPGRSVAVYVILAYVITWIAVSPLVLSAQGRVAAAIPGWWHAVGAAGPITAALVASRLSGRRTLTSFASSLGRFRIGARWWGVAAGTPLALAAVAVAVGRLASGSWLGGLPAAWDDPGWLVSTAAVSVAYGVGEEPGWRGFLLPGLMRSHSAVTATAMVAVVWAAWHVPFFAYRYDFDGAGTVIGFFIAMLAGASWLSWVYLGTGGSVPAVAAWHALWNVVNLAAAEISGTVLAVMNGLIIVLGLAVFPLVGRRRRPTASASRGSP